MSPEVLQRAFEPFFTTKQEGRGTGLGLAMVYGFAKQSGGYAEIDSKPGEGTRVTMYLPRSGEAPKAAADANESDNAIAGSERILLVEDDQMVREFIQSALGKLGYRVIAKSNARDALDYLAHNSIDLLLTDLILPGGISGNELAAEAARSRQGLRVLFASGYTEDSLIREGRLQPGQALLAKPFSGRVLARRVREALAG